MTRRIPAGINNNWQLAMKVPVNPTLASSAALKRVPDFKLDNALRSTSIQWQTDCFLYNTLIGQVGKVNNLVANTVAACAVEATRVDATKRDEEDPRVQRVMRAFLGPIGGQRELLRRAALNLKIAGETFLIGTPSMDLEKAEYAELKGDSPQLLWEFVSPLELKTDRGSVSRTRAGFMSAVSGKLRKDAYVARCWVSDPAATELPDCAMRRAIPDCRQYVLLRQVIDAEIATALSAGIFAVPEEMSFGPEDESQEDPSAEGDLDPFTSTLLEHMSAPIENRESASSLVPLVIRGTAEDISAMKILEMGGAHAAAWAVDRRKETLTSIGQILDSPPETIQGKGQLNHWTGYSVDEELNSKWVIPLGEFIAEFVTAAYLRPMLVAYEGMTEAEANEWEVTFDPSNITARADKGTTFLQLYDRQLVSASATRNANGATESDAPTTEEAFNQRVLDIVMMNPLYYLPMIKQVPGYEDFDIDLLMTDPDTLHQAVDQIGDNPEGDKPVSRYLQRQRPPEPAAPQAPPASMDPASGGGPPVPPEQKMSVAHSADMVVVERLLTAADTTMERALEKAGNRIVSSARSAGHPCRDRINGRPTGEALSLVSDADLADIGLSVDAVIGDAWDTFNAQANVWVRAWIAERSQRDAPMAQDIARALVDQMCSQLTSVVATTRGVQRFEEGRRVPRHLVIDALSTVTSLSY